MNQTLSSLLLVQKTSNDNDWLLRTNRGLRIGEAFFRPDIPENVACDVFRINYSPNRGPKGFSKPRATITLDLQVEEDVIFRKLKGDTRTKIRRAERDGILHQLFTANPEEALRFAHDYVAFARRNGLPAHIAERLTALALMGRLTLSYATEQSGVVLTAHAYYDDGLHCRLLYSVTTDDAWERPRSLVGRAHRYHHWRDIAAFNRSGTRTYDLGGFYLGKNDRKKLAINAFKQEFGDRVIPEYTTVIPLSLKGWLATPFMLAAA